MALEFHLKYKFNLKQEYMTVWHLWLLVWGLYFPVQLLNNSKILSTFAYEATSYIASIKEPIFPPYSKIWDWLSSTQWKKRKKKYTISVPIFKKSMLHAVASHQGLNSFIFLQSAPSTHPHNNPAPHIFLLYTISSACSSYSSILEFLSQYKSNTCTAYLLFSHQLFHHHILIHFFHVAIRSQCTLIYDFIYFFLNSNHLSNFFILHSITYSNHCSKVTSFVPLLSSTSLSTSIHELKLALWFNAFTH